GCRARRLDIVPQGCSRHEEKPRAPTEKRNRWEGVRAGAWVGGTNISIEGAGRSSALLAVSAEIDCVCCRTEMHEVRRANGEAGGKRSCRRQQAPEAALVRSGENASRCGG